jgi:hypothetical protein
MPDLIVSDSDWQSLSADDQAGITNAMSQSFGYNIAPSGSGVSMTALESANTASPTGSNAACEGDCSTMKDKCLGICEGMRDAKTHDYCVTVCWGSYGICLLECAAGI